LLLFSLSLIEDSFSHMIANIVLWLWFVADVVMSSIFQLNKHCEK